MNSVFFPAIFIPISSLFFPFLALSFVFIYIEK